MHKFLWVVTAVVAWLQAVGQTIEDDCSHVLVLDENGIVHAWGANDYGQCNVPNDLGNIRAIEAVSNGSLALKHDGTIAAWGQNRWGELNIPSGLNGVEAIECGTAHCLALLKDQTVVAWGDNSVGQCDVPEGLKGVESLYSSGNYSVALKDDGTIAVWGSRFRPHVKNGLSADFEIHRGIVAVACGFSHFLVLKKDGTVAAFGADEHGETLVPDGLSDVIQVGVSLYKSYALQADGTIVQWGLRTANNPPSELKDVEKFAASGVLNLALLKSGAVVEWGNSTLDSPTQIPPNLNGIVDIYAGCDWALAIKQDGSVVAWGENENSILDVPDAIRGNGDIQLRNEFGIWFVEVIVNGFREEFALDTGAGITCLSPEAVRYLRHVRAIPYDLIPVRQVSLVDASGNESFLDVFRLSWMTVGNVTVQDVEVVFLENEGTTSLLGQSFLGKTGGFSFNPKMGVLNLTR